MSSQKEQLRLKIKKLKYKIEKQQKLNQQYNRLMERLNRFSSEKLSITKILKKINFLLSVKGMNINDWIRAYPYDQQLEIDQLVTVLEKMGIKLPREEKGLLTNFIGDQFCQFITLDDFRKIIEENGLQLGD